MSNSTPIVAVPSSTKVVVLDNRLQGIRYKEAFKVDPEALAPELGDFVWQLWHHYYMLEWLRSCITEFQTGDNIPF